MFPGRISIDVLLIERYVEIMVGLPNLTAMSTHQLEGA